MRLYRRGSRWWVVYHVDQTRYRESTGCTDQRAAERRARTIIADRERGVTGREAGIVRRKATTVREAVADWLASIEADVAAGARSAGHLRSLRSHARLYIVPALGSRVLGELGRADLQRWRDDLRDGRTSATVNRIVCSLRSLLSWAVEREIIDSAPTAGLRALRERPAARHRALSDAEVDAWKAALRTLRLARRAPWRLDDMVDWIDLLRETGLRDDESVGLTVGMVDIDRRCIELPATLCKGAKARMIPLSTAAIAVLSPRIEGRELTARIFEPMSRRKALEVAWTTTGLEGRIPTAHDLRHTAACRWVRAGWTLTEIQHALGHKSPTTTARYLHRYGRRHADLAAALDRLTAEQPSE